MPRDTCIVFLTHFWDEVLAFRFERLRRESAGSGALGDLGAHIVDAAQFVTGDLITGVSALTNTFVRQRPAENGGTDDVTVDDTTAKDVL